MGGIINAGIVPMAEDERRDKRDSGSKMSKRSQRGDGACIATSVFTLRIRQFALTVSGCGMADQSPETVVQNRIVKARRTQTTSLRLNDLGPTELPEYKGQLNQNQLLEVPVMVG